MERAKKSTNDNGDPIITWRKLGGGSLRLGGKIIKPGQEFRATEAEIPTIFRSMCLPLSEIPAKAPEEALKVTSSQFKKVPRGNTTKFNVVGKNDKVINEKPLTEKEADDFLKVLG